MVIIVVLPLLQLVVKQMDIVSDSVFNLQPVTWLGFLVSIPGTTCRLTLLIGRQPVHPIADQDAVRRGGSHVNVVESMQIAPDPPRAKAVPFSQIEDLGDNRTRGCARRVERRPWLIAQTGLTVALEPGQPLIKSLAGKAVMAAGLGYASRHRAGFANQLQPPGNQSILL